MSDFDKESFLKKNAIWLVVLVAFVIFGFLLFKGWDKLINDEIDGKITITGNFICLPLLKAETASSKEKCVLGIKSRDNFYFALDISRIQDANTDLKVNDTIAVTGTLRPESDIATSEWAVYKIKGIVLVNTLLRTK